MFMEYGFIKVTADDQLSVIETKSAVLENQDLWDQIGGFYEIVSPMILRYTEWRDVRILCDESGLLKDGQKINRLASGLYGAPSPIVGTVLLVRQGFTEDGEPDIFPFSASQLFYAEKFFSRMLNELKSVKL